jgi:hypothetical protein
MNSTLPGHMQNQGTRHGVTSHHEKNIRQLRSHEADFATLKSTLNDRKLFRVDPETGKPYGRPIKHKKSKFTQKANNLYRAHIHRVTKEEWLRG